MSRRGGILLHPTSLPGPHGIGDLGSNAHRWLDFLQAAGMRLWQVLPLGPTGFGDSPYQAFSSHAGNPLLISLQDLGLLSDEELEPLTRLPADHVDFGPVIQERTRLLRLAASRFTDNGPEFSDFCAENAHWLEDYALFSVLKSAHGGGVWTAWPRAERLREPEALAAARERQADELHLVRVQQFWFRQQWQKLRQAAAERDIIIMGDVPIFVAFDSADTWADQDLFDLTPDGNPRTVAGVPPDYFSETGQRWGNPLYVWDRHAATGYAWWIRRVRSSLQLHDLVRIDHFRGFEAYWSIPASEETAVRGEWLPGPGQQLFTALKAAIPDLPLVAEDLGVITPAVEQIRDDNGFPGMRILQFAFGSEADDPFLPHNYVRNCVAYTGTHDNDTSLGWYRTAPDHARDHVRKYLATDDASAVWRMVRAVLASVADTAVIPLQDALQQGSEARMNTPGRAGGNWSYRFSWDDIPDWLAGQLAEMNRLFGRS